MSFVQWLTRSWPIVSWRFASIATLIFVPTPSALATRSGAFTPSGTRNIPPNPPKAPRAPAVKVLSTSALMRPFASSAASMLTPASPYVIAPGFGPGRESEPLTSELRLEGDELPELRHARGDVRRRHLEQPLDAELLDGEAA